MLEIAKITNCRGTFIIESIEDTDLRIIEVFRGPNHVYLETHTRRPQGREGFHSYPLPSTLDEPITSTPPPELLETAINALHIHIFLTAHPQLRGEGIPQISTFLFGVEKTRNKANAVTLYHTLTRVRNVTLAPVM